MSGFNRFRIPGLERKYFQGARNLALILIVQIRERNPAFFHETGEELRELAYSANIQIADLLEIKLPEPSPSHFLRKGKLEEVAALVARSGANTVIFSSELTPTQIGNVESAVKASVMDRTGLILDIFSRRAKSREGKLQVELAQLQYTLPRIGGLGGVMSRTGGGVGTRGPGEQELEKDKRKVRLRIRQVKSELEEVKKHRKLVREGRKRRHFTTVSLVGYTNAGKSTLMNALTGADSLVENKMFATLDPVTRVEKLNGRSDILFIDTVGFLRNLPHALVEAFHATLEETAEADILIHVLDAASPQREEFKSSVEKVLREIKAETKPVILALNKADLLSDEQKTRLTTLLPEGVLVSAKEKQGLQGLLAKIYALAGIPEDSPL